MTRHLSFEKADRVLSSLAERPLSEGIENMAALQGAT
jgi:hypothetical protein